MFCDSYGKRFRGKLQLCINTTMSITSPNERMSMLGITNTSNSLPQHGVGIQDTINMQVMIQKFSNVASSFACC